MTTTTNETITTAGEHLPAQPAPAAKPASRRQAKTSNPAEDRAVRAASAKAPANGKAPARRSRASRGAAKTDSAKGKATAAKPATKATAKPAAKAQKPAKPEASGWTQQAKRELFRAVIVAGGELVAKLPADVRAEAGQDLANQLHHLTRQNFGWPGKLPVPIRSDWTGYKP
jgi:hypothetical protein